MKYTLALLLAASALMALQAQAAKIDDLVLANCTKAIMSGAAQVTRGDLKLHFRLVPNGSGWSYSGPDENKRNVECLAAADGHVVWVHNG